MTTQEKNLAYVTQWNRCCELCLQYLRDLDPKDWEHHILHRSTLTPPECLFVEISALIEGGLRDVLTQKFHNAAAGITSYRAIFTPIDTTGRPDYELLRSWKL